MQTKPKAVVLLSGGLDSTTCLAIALAQGYECYTLSFDYGQKHKAELLAAQKISTHFGAASHLTINLNLKNMLSSALTSDDLTVPDYQVHNEIPITYVPARNTIFLSFALGYAESLGAEAVFTGICAVDYSNYPDCRPAFLRAFQNLADVATKQGLEQEPIRFYAPLLYLSKAEIIREGVRLGVDYGLTTSCYRANEDGQACGSCESCHLRKQGFVQAQISDPTRYV